MTRTTGLFLLVVSAPIGMGATSHWPSRIELFVPRGCDWEPVPCPRFGGGAIVAVEGQDQTVSTSLSGDVRVECSKKANGVFASVDAPTGFPAPPAVAECRFEGAVVYVDIDRRPDPTPGTRQTGPSSFEVSVWAGGFRAHSFKVDLEEQRRRSDVRGVRCRAEPQESGRALIVVIDDRRAPSAVVATCSLRTMGGEWVTVTADVHVP
jgi:hypothetical protein